MNFLKLKNWLLSNTDLQWMNQHVSIENVPQKARKLSKNDEFVTNETIIQYSNFEL